MPSQALPAALIKCRERAKEQESGKGKEDESGRGEARGPRIMDDGFVGYGQS